MRRRNFLATLAAAPVAVSSQAYSTAATRAHTRVIPSTGEALPVIGMGTWITFDVGEDQALRDSRLEVMRAFFAAGGGMVDSSPMYGSAEAVVGHCLSRLPADVPLFAATKVWTPLAWHGRRQMEESEKLWHGRRMDLQQVHNLVGVESHLQTLGEWKQQGRIRYVGITTSHGARHEQMEKVMKEWPLDFVQLTYNLLDRAAERRLLPLAAERGIAVVANRPFRRGALLHTLKQHPLPDWAAEFDAYNWAQFCLGFIVSHPAVTCAIPATSQVPHMVENMGAGRGRLPDPAMRERMARHVAGL